MTNYTMRPVHVQSAIVYSLQSNLGNRQNEEKSLDLVNSYSLFTAPWSLKGATDSNHAPYTRDKAGQ